MTNNPEYTLNVFFRDPFTELINNRSWKIDIEYSIRHLRRSLEINKLKT